MRSSNVPIKPQANPESIILFPDLMVTNCIFLGAILKSLLHIKRAIWKLKLVNTIVTNITSNAFVPESLNMHNPDRPKGVESAKIVAGNILTKGYFSNIKFIMQFYMHYGLSFHTWLQEELQQTKFKVIGVSLRRSWVWKNTASGCRHFGQGLLLVLGKVGSDGKSE